MDKVIIYFQMHNIMCHYFFDGRIRYNGCFCLVFSHPVSRQVSIHLDRSGDAADRPYLLLVSY